MLLAVSPGEDLLHRPEEQGQAPSGKVIGSGGVRGFSENPHILCVAAVSPFTTHNIKKVRTSQLYLQRCDFNHVMFLGQALLRHISESRG